MIMSDILDVLKENFDCDESGLDWQEHKYNFVNDTGNIYDMNVNGITIHDVMTCFLTDEELIITGKHDLVLASLPTETIESIIVVKK